jgi:CRISPR-associated endonuclease/helicase Cas3
MPQAEFMNALFPKHQEQRNKAFLYKPVLVCTIDHMMAATETKRGGKYILPSLRLSSSDLVIDEVDDFNGQDLIAIARLVHLAGMLGRKVMISSATIPPALAEGFFNAYQQGWSLYCAFKKENTYVQCGLMNLKPKFKSLIVESKKRFTAIKYT